MLSIQLEPDQDRLSWDAAVSVMDSVIHRLGHRNRQLVGLDLIQVQLVGYLSCRQYHRRKRFGAALNLQCLHDHRASSHASLPGAIPYGSSRASEARHGLVDGRKGRQVIVQVGIRDHRGHLDARSGQTDIPACRLRGLARGNKGPESRAA